jgi:hypothetical protein
VYTTEGKEFINHFHKYLAIEREQIIEACENTIKSFELDKDKTGLFVMGGEGYYNKTYKPESNETL